MTVVLIHWKPEEAQARVEELRRCGFEVECLAPQGAARLREFDQKTPGVFLIDLGRLPSQGRAVGVELRRRKSTRWVPLVFVGGERERVERVKELLPDATYTGWEGVAAAIGTARPLAAPVAPDTMAGYSGVPLVRKLGIKPDAGVLLLGAPVGFERKLGPFTRARAAHRVLLFARSVAEMQRRFKEAATRVADGGGLWIVWPKKGSGVASDLSEAGVRGFGLAAGWVDYKICAVDAIWSGLLFARRK